MTDPFMRPQPKYDEMSALRRRAGIRPEPQPATGAVDPEIIKVLRGFGSKHMSPTQAGKYAEYWTNTVGDYARHGDLPALEKLLRTVWMKNAGTRVRDDLQAVLQAVQAKLPMGESLSESPIEVSRNGANLKIAPVVKTPILSAMTTAYHEANPDPSQSVIWQRMFRDFKSSADYVGLLAELQRFIARLGESPVAVSLTGLVTRIISLLNQELSAEGSRAYNVARTLASRG